MRSERQTYKTMARHWEPLIAASAFIAFLRCEYGTVKSIKPIAETLDPRLIQKIRGWIVLPIVSPMTHILQERGRLVEGCE